MWYVGKLDILFHHTPILAVNSDWRLDRRVKGGFHIARGLDPKYSSVVHLISRTYGIVIELSALDFFSPSIEGGSIRNNVSIRKGKGWRVEFVVVRDTDAVISSVVAGLGTGAFYKVAAGLRLAAVAGVIGGVVVGLGVIAKQAQKRYVPI
ncbi:hypothetical protein BC332_12889 [Capsicum chinense]|nr:hypothetical protein BC332_12889 [Capsicum chinense]